jgi:hypothetical protein
MAHFGRVGRVRDGRVAHDPDRPVEGRVLRCVGVQGPARDAAGERSHEHPQRDPARSERRRPRTVQPRRRAHHALRHRLAECGRIELAQRLALTRVLRDALRRLRIGREVRLDLGTPGGVQAPVRVRMQVVLGDREQAHLTI